MQAVASDGFEEALSSASSAQVANHRPTARGNPPLSAGIQSEPGSKRLDVPGLASHGSLGGCWGAGVSDRHEAGGIQLAIHAGIASAGIGWAMA